MSFYSFKSGLFFAPSFNDGSHEIRVNAMQEADMGVRPRWHWCVLATVVDVDGGATPKIVPPQDMDGSPANPMILVRDNLGVYQGFEIDVHGQYDVWVRVMEHCRKDNTVAIFYPPPFVRGAIWMVDATKVLFFNLPMNMLLKMGTEFAAYDTGSSGPVWCHGCDRWRQRDQMFYCEGCLSFHYCGPDCQYRGWYRKSHSDYCVVLQDANVQKMLRLQYIDGKNLERVSFDPLPDGVWTVCPWKGAGAQ